MVALLATLVVSVLRFVSITRRSKSQPAPAVPKAATEAAMINKINDPIPALAALYEGEKTDASAVFNGTVAMLGFAVAYLVWAMPFVGTLTLSHEPTAKLFLVLLPFPLWLISAFHSLMTLNAMSHGISVRIIEDALFASSGLPPATRELVGSAAGDKVMDITQSRVAHKITTVVVYAGVLILGGVFTVYALYSATKVVVLVHMPVVEVAAATYSLLLIMVAWSWIAGIYMINKGRKEIPKHEN